MNTELELIESLLEDFSTFKTKSLKEFNDFKEKDFQARQSEYNSLQDQIKELQARGGRLSGGFQQPLTTKQAIANAIQGKAQDIANLNKGGKVNYDLVLKAVGTMTAATHLTGGVQVTYASEAAVRGKPKLHFRDIVQVLPSATGSWTFYRENSPAGEGSVSFQTTHGALKSQLDKDLTAVNITVDYLAGFAVIAKQMMQDLPFIQSYISDALVDDYLRAEDNVFFGALYSAATGPTTTSGANTAEKIIDIVASMEDNDYEVNGILVTPSIWASLLKTNLGSGAGYGVPGGITITPSGDIAIAGIPIWKTKASNIGNNKVLLGDFSKVKIIQAEGLTVNFSESDNDNFRRNLITAKVEARTNIAILRPDAFSYFTA